MQQRFATDNSHATLKYKFSTLLAFHLCRKALQKEHMFRLNRTQKEESTYFNTGFSMLDMKTPLRNQSSLKKSNDFGLQTQNKKKRSVWQIWKIWVLLKETSNDLESAWTQLRKRYANNGIDTDIFEMLLTKKKRYCTIKPTLHSYGIRSKNLKKLKWECESESNN